MYDYLDVPSAERRELAMTALRDRLDAADAAFEASYRQSLSLYGRVMYVLARLARPVLYWYRRVVDMRKAISQYGAAIRAKEGISTFRQAIHQIQLARQGIDPEDYYRYMLYREANRADARYFLFHADMDVLINGLAQERARDKCQIAADKVRFYRHCMKRGIQTIPALAVVGPSTVTFVSTDRTLPPSDLFSKPVDWWQGKGAAQWVRQGGGWRRPDEAGAQLTEQELLARLQVQARTLNRKVLIQPRIRNHPALRDLVGETLSAVRIITALEPDDDTVRDVIGLIGIPNGDQPTSNFQGSNLAAPVNLQTGIVGPARRQDPREVMQEWHAHPRSEKPIQGVRLPDWKAALALVRAAHQTLKPIPFLGWDVALTPDGPTIIECNVGFGAKNIQLTHQVPLGKTVFAQLYYRHLR